MHFSEKRDSFNRNESSTHKRNEKDASLNAMNESYTASSDSEDFVIEDFTTNCNGESENPQNLSSHVGKVDSKASKEDKKDVKSKVPTGKDFLMRNNRSKLLIIPLCIK